MQQIFHIFRKDLRHFWPEVVACLIATIDFARVYPAQWMPDDGLHLSLGSVAFPALSMTTLSGILTALVPITWFVLIVRVVQDEALVGTKLYWVTRPYELRKLFAAKVLFIALFAAVPFAAAQLVIFLEAGFNPFDYGLRLLLMVLLSLAAFALPMISLATITRSFLQASVALLAICAIVVAMAFLISDGPLSSHISTPYSDNIGFPFFVLICGGVVISQYVTRKVWRARVLALSMIPVFLLLGSNPFEVAMIESRYYPDAPGSIPLHLSIPPVTPETRADRKPVVTDGDNAKQVTLSIPLEIASVPAGSIVTPNDAKLRIVAADGSSWTSSWHSVYNHDYRPGTAHGAISVQVDRAFLDRVRSRPVRLELTLALTHTMAAASFSTDVPVVGDIQAPAFGLCSLIQDATEQSSPLRCRFPLGAPHTTVVTALFTGKPCPREPTEVKLFPMTAAYGELHPDPTDAWLVPVRDAELNFSDSAGTDSGSRYNGYLCPGTAVTFTRYDVARRARYTVVAQDMMLPR